ncbi:hypothetical protein C2E23DRAFT_200432 [Lenzites betulinus]|nr:hypothetical protein C2E23DRAFT_200432 [Lenzites betulinus]
MYQSSPIYKQTHLLRPRDLLAPSPPPHEPTAPAELFTAALLDGDFLGLERVTLEPYKANIIVQLQVQEIRGAVEGIFQDPSTYKLRLVLHPRMFMTPLVVFIAEFVGDECQRSAPTWLKTLARAPRKLARRNRSYEWLMRWVIQIFTTPGELPAAYEWRKVLEFALRIKEVCDMRTRVIDPTRTPPRPRPRRSPLQLVDAMHALSLQEGREPGTSLSAGGDAGGEDAHRSVLGPLNI